MNAAAAVEQQAATVVAAADGFSRKFRYVSKLYDAESSAGDAL